MLQAKAIVDRAGAEDPRDRTLGEQLDARLRCLLRSIGQEEKLPAALAVANLLGRGWREQRTTVGPRWASDITDDHTPFEFSLALNGHSETLRLLTEPQDAAHPSLGASWRLANELHEELARDWGASLEAFQHIAELFAPGPSATARFSIWHSAIMGHPRDPEFKVYLNPAINGAADSERVLEEALARLGLLDVWRDLAGSVLRSGGLDEPVYFSLDLSSKADARVKIYVAHRQATCRSVAKALSRSPGFAPENVQRWLKQLMGGAGPFLERPPITCFALQRGSIDLLSTTLHLPVRCYLAEDFEIARRVCGFLGFAQRVRYMRALTRLAERPLESGRGLHTYASLRASPGRQAVTVYLAPQLYSTDAPLVEEAPLSFFNKTERSRFEQAS
jgi:DMATS type aromatic prenyltransferase